MHARVRDPRQLAGVAGVVPLWARKAFQVRGSSSAIRNAAQRRA